MEKRREKIGEIEILDYAVYALWALEKLGYDIKTYIRKFCEYEDTVSFYDGKTILKNKFSVIIRAPRFADCAEIF